MRKKVEITDVVCPLCGCVCDDIVVEVEKNEVKNEEGKGRMCSGKEQANGAWKNKKSGDKREW